MSQPIRVEGWAYTPGAQVRLRLRFRSQSSSQSSYARVKAESHNPFGGVIKLEGVSHPTEESGAAHTEVVFTGDRRWVPIFEDPAFNIRVVQRPFHAQRGEEFLGLEPAQRAGSLTRLGEACCSDEKTRRILRSSSLRRQSEVTIS
jgi:hypothetical protein